jgi:hypothetical protein
MSDRVGGLRASHNPSGVVAGVVRDTAGVGDAATGRTLGVPLVRPAAVGAPLVRPTALGAAAVAAGALAAPLGRVLPPVDGRAELLGAGDGQVAHPGVPVGGSAAAELDCSGAAPDDGLARPDPVAGIGVTGSTVTGSGVALVAGGAASPLPAVDPLVASSGARPPNSPPAAA